MKGFLIFFGKKKSLFVERISLEESGDICEGTGVCWTNEGKSAHPIKGTFASPVGEEAESVAIPDQ